MRVQKPPANIPPSHIPPVTGRTSGDHQSDGQKGNSGQNKKDGLSPFIAYPIAFVIVFLVLFIFVWVQGELPNNVGSTVKLNRTPQAMIQMFAGTPPGGGSPTVIFSPEEIALYNLSEDCESAFTFCIGTGGTLIAGFKCGNTGSEIEFSSRGEISLTAAHDAHGLVFPINEPFSERIERVDIVKTNADNKVVLNATQFLQELNSHMNDNDCPLLSLDLCITRSDPSIGFTYTCNEVTTSVMLDGQLKVTATGQDGLYQMAIGPG